MNPAQSLLKEIINAGEGTRKDGFTVGNVTYTINQNNTITFSGTIPIAYDVDATTGAITVTSEDWLNAPV